MVEIYPERLSVWERRIVGAWKLTPCIKPNFGVWRLLHAKYLVRMRLGKWSQHSLICPLCKGTLETHQHVFWECPISQAVWCKLIAWLYNAGLVDRITWKQALSSDKGRLNESQYKVWCLDRAITIQEIWFNRNEVVFN